MGVATAWIRRIGRLAGIALAMAIAAPAAISAEPGRPRVEATMKRATRFMVETVSTNGGYVWSYLPDMSRRWGELEAFPSMIWIQPPGTPTMGHLFLDAYHVTGDDYYYQAAQKAADALIAVQQHSGGWHYFGDFGGEASTRRWYETIGRNAWRLEEFQHYWGNATFDDAGTAESMMLLLRLYVERHDPRYRPALDRAIGFVLDSQYPIGGWPQRFPLRNEFVHHGKPDYTGFITFNDDVAGENIRFLLMCQQVLPPDPRIHDAIVRAMNVYLVTQGGAAQPGWALQYTTDLTPTGARTYEPTALATHTTAANIRMLFWFYRLTGDSKFLARVPEALDWLDRVKLPPAQQNRRGAWPTFVEVGSNAPLFVHRRGSNVVNGAYYVDRDPVDTIGHYSSFRSIDMAALRGELAALTAADPAALAAASPLRSGRATPLPRYFVASEPRRGTPETAAAVVAALNAQGWWPAPLTSTSHPYAGDGAAVPPAGDFRSTNVGDATDTSPYPDPAPKTGISLDRFIRNMAILIGAIDPAGVKAAQR